MVVLRDIGSFGEEEVNAIIWGSVLASDVGLGRYVMHFAVLSHEISKWLVMVGQEVIIVKYSWKSCKWKSLRI